MAIDPITAAINVGGKFLDKFVGDKDLKEKLAHDEEMQELVAELQSTVGQLEINKAEAQHSSIFVSGWRPAVGWICGVALGYHYVLYPFLKFGAVLIMDNPPDFPSLSLGDLMPVLLGMLGLGSMRSYEKSKDKARRNMAE